MSEFIEEKFREGVSLRFDIKQRLFKSQSDFQLVEIVDSTHHGKMLFNDGCAMISERDEAIYHEMMAHVPMLCHSDPRNVLIIGGGDGGTAREVLRHSSVEKCVMVEIDSDVVEGCRRHIPLTSSSFENPKLELIIGDGLEYVAQKSNWDKFDVILVDSTDPVGPAQPLFGRDFYKNIFACLRQDGIVVAQGESPFYQADAQLSLLKIIGEFAKIRRPYNFTNMTYPGGLWSFIYASRDRNPLSFRKLQLQPMFYYNEAIHQAAFSLPSFQERTLREYIQ